MEISPTNPPFFRKFAFDTRISEEFGIPESVADFIQGRIPTRVGARHYTKLLRQADGHYKKYIVKFYKIRCALEQ